MKTNSKLLYELERYAKSLKPVVDERILEEANRYENSLYEYLKVIWPIIEGGEFVDGWHIRAISEHLEAVARGEIKRLLINVPPRTGKSNLVSVAFPTWVWTVSPEHQFLFISYVANLSMKDAVKSRRILESNFYKRLWGHKVKLLGDSNTKQRYDNTKTGYRISSSVGGSATGQGASTLVLDDPNNASDSSSDTKRESVNDWCDHVLSTRLNDPKTGSVVIVQQRLHQQDYSGHILAKEIPGLTYLVLPMEFESYRRCSTIILPSTNGILWTDPRTKEGELLWPERFGPKELETLKSEMNDPYIISGQLQQRPSPQEGGIFQKSWIQIYKEPSPPQCDFIIQSWDTALSVKATACYSACVNIGIFKDKYNVSQAILLSTWRGRVEYPDLRKMATRLSKCIYDTNLDAPVPEDYIFRPHMIVVEKAANGLSLIQDLNRAGLIVNAFDPRKNGGDKVSRARLATQIIEGGRFWLPARAPTYEKLRPFAETFLEELCLFPNGESKDMTDAFSQAILKLMSSGMINNPDDDIVRASYREKKALY